MSPQHLQIQRRSARVLEVWLNRPARRNAFHPELIEELRATFATVGDDPELRAVVLGGRGEAFCAGGDLAWMREAADYDETRNLADARQLAEMLWTVQQCPLPVIGRIHGDCMGGGVGLAAVCDIVVAEPQTRFALSEVRLGLVPATIGPYVIQAIGVRAARRYALTAESFDGTTAWQLGLVHELAPEGALDPCVDRLCSALAANGPAALRAAKRMLHAFAGRVIDAGLREDSAGLIATVRAGSEAREGLAAFLARRAPDWR